MQPSQHKPILALSRFLLILFSYTANAATIEDSLVLIKSGNYCGTGFICEMDDDFYIISNAHVLERPDKYTFTSMSGKEIQIVDMEVADKLDLARWRIYDVDVAALNISSCNPCINDQIAVYGNNSGSMTVGKLKGKVTGIGPDAIEVNANIGQGNSGSPIIDKNGMILGVATYAENKKPDWFAEKSKTSETLKYGIRLNNNAKWNKVALNKITQQTALLNDIDRYLSDIAYVTPKMMAKTEPSKKTNAGAAKTAKTETSKKTNCGHNIDDAKSIANGIIECTESESLYNDKSWFKLIKDLCAARNKYVLTLIGQSKGSMYDPASLKIAEGNKFKQALDDVYNAPTKKLKGNEWISSYYREKSDLLQGYASSLSNAVYKIKISYKLEGLAYEKLKL